MKEKKKFNWIQLIAGPTAAINESINFINQQREKEQLRHSPTQLQLIAGLTAPPAINGIECCWLPLPYRAAWAAWGPAWRSRQRQLIHLISFFIKQINLACSTCAHLWIASAPFIHSINCLSFVFFLWRSPWLASQPITPTKSRKKDN